MVNFRGFIRYIYYYDKEILSQREIAMVEDEIEEENKNKKIYEYFLKQYINYFYKKPFSRL